LSENSGELASRRPGTRIRAAGQRRKAKRYAYAITGRRKVKVKRGRGGISQLKSDQLSEVKKSERS